MDEMSHSYRAAAAAATAAPLPPPPPPESAAAAELACERAVRVAVGETVILLTSLLLPY